MDESFELHRQRRGLFTGSAALYDDGRPGYPPELFEILRERCGLGPGCRVLEIGPGTGQATGALLDAGAAVVAVELGSELAARLTAKYAQRDIEVVVSPFEDVDLGDARFDIVAAGTSFHWVPPDAALDRCAAALHPGGSLALFWNFFGDPDRDDPFHEALQPLLQRHAPALIAPPGSGNPGTGAHPYALDVAARTREIDASGWFGPVTHDIIGWTGRHSAEEIRRMFGSFSPFLALDAATREPLLEALEALAEHEFGGAVARPYLTPVYTAVRREDGSGPGHSADDR